MTDLASKILFQIKQHRFSEIPMGDGLIMPFYDGLSLINIPGSIVRWLDAPSFGKPPLADVILTQLDPHYKKVILLLVDALGYSLLNKILLNNDNLVWSRYQDRAVYLPLTSVCPSTTATALTSLWTGEGPAVHGIIGYEMWAKEFSMVINNILHTAVQYRSDVGGLERAGFDPQLFMDLPLLGTHLNRSGIDSTTFIHHSISNSGLSTMQMKDVSVNAYSDEADVCVSLAEYLNNRQGVKEYIYVYYSDVDTLMHRFSADDSRVTFQFEAFSYLFERAFLKKLSSNVAKETLLVMLADHGSMATPLNPRYDLRNHPELLNNLVMQPTCENRLAFLFIKPGKETAVRDYFRQTWPDEFILIESDRALENGLFGPGPFHGNTLDRLGNLIAVALGNAYLWWAPKPNHMQGRHGGLSQEEMLVPFYALSLGELVD